MLRRTNSKRSIDGDLMAGRALLGVLALSLVLLLSWSSSALALSQRGHSFAATVGAGAGSGDGQLASPNAVAVSEATGDVYVTDRNNDRVVQFGPNGEFVSAWGIGVSDGSKNEYEVCKKGCQAGVGPKVKEGEFSLKKGQFLHPYAIAVDNSTSLSDPSKGDVYVVADLAPENTEESVVWKFGPNGESTNGKSIQRLTSKEQTEFNGRADGVAVDANGVAWVDWSDETVLHYTNGEPNKLETPELEEKAGVTMPFEEEISLAVSPLRFGLAIDSNDNLYVPYEVAAKFEEDEETGEGVGGQESCTLSPCVVAKIATREQGETSPGEPLTPALLHENATGFAVDRSDNDVYLDNGTSVAALNSSGELIQRFGSEQVETLGGPALIQGTGVAVDSVTDSVYVADASANRIVVFGQKPAGAPEAHELAVTEVTGNSATLNAQAEADGIPSSFTFEYGTQACSSPGTCASVAASPSALEGFTDHPISAKVELLAGTLYHYRVRGENTSKQVSFSEERTFTTPAETNGYSPADGRALELVTPTEKNGTSFESSPKEGGLIEAAAGGNAMTEIALAPSDSKPEGNRNPEFTQVLSKRTTNAKGEKEWQSEDIDTPNNEIIGVFENTQEFQFFTPDLSEALVNPIDTPLLSPNASEKTLYLRTNEDCAPAPSTCYLPLVTGAPGVANVPTGTKFAPGTGERFKFEVATSDLRHVVFSSKVQLTGETAATGSNLYEWTKENPPATQLQLVSVTGEGAVAGADVGDQDQGDNARNAISADGSQVVFSAKKHLYLRNTVAKTTTQLDAPGPGGESTESGQGPRFQTASSNGARIFFTDNQKLNGESTSSSTSPDGDLYVYTVGAAEPLKDLSVDPQIAEPNEQAGVRNIVPGASEDGTVIYFVADGVLTATANARGEKASPGICKETESERAFGTTCNLYEQQLVGGAWTGPRFIATLSQEDERDWFPRNNDELNGLSAHVSQSGQYLAFMSNRSLTDYDNRDANPESHNAADQEVYLYDDVSNAITCVSCNPSGARPTGVLDPNAEQTPEGVGLLIDRAKEFEGKWLAGTIPGWSGYSSLAARYETRVLLNSGRMFFNSTNALVPSDVNGKTDVFEYEPAGVGSCTQGEGCISPISPGTSLRESAFLDASEDGNNAFFLTAAPLTGRDHDSAFDVYDARVCGSEGCISPDLPSSSNCASGEECKGPAPGAPSAAGSATPSTSSTNVTPKTGVFPSVAVKPAAKKLTRAQLKAKALKACKKLKKKKKRVACEKAARKKYASHAKKPSKKKKKGTK